MGNESKCLDIRRVCAQLGIEFSKWEELEDSKAEAAAAVEKLEQERTCGQKSQPKLI